MHLITDRPPSLIILGAAKYPLCPPEFSRESFRISAESFVQVSKKHFSVPEERTLNLFDQDQANTEYDRKIVEFLRANANFPIILYYVGHGGFYGD